MNIVIYLFYVILNYMQNICLIIGAGAGIGGNVAKVFANDGYHVYLTRRSDENGLKKLIDQINTAGGKASGKLLNAVQDNTIEELVHDVERDIGPVSVVIYNLGAQIGNKKLEDLTLKQFDLGFKMGTSGIFRLCRSTNTLVSLFALFPWNISIPVNILMLQASS